MTVAASLDTIVGPFQGDGSTQAFSFPWPYFESGDVNAWVKDADGTVHVLIEGGDYSVDAQNQTLTLGSPLAQGKEMILTSGYEDEQDIDFTSQGRFFPERHEQGFDYTVLLIKQLLQKLDRISNFSNATPFGTFDVNQASVDDIIIGGNNYLDKVLAAVSSVTAPYHIAFSFSDEISAGANVGAWVCPQNFNVDFPQGIGETGAYAAVPPASSAEFEVQRNGTRVGAVQFPTGSNTANIIVDDSAFEVTGNDQLSIISPSPADPNLSDVSITLAGRRIPWLS